MDGQIQLEGLTKRYEIKERLGLFKSRRREIVALQEVNLEIRPGEIFGLLGPNGAGKTTLIKCLTTLLIPTSGRACINGYQLGIDDKQIRSSIGCMLMGERGLYWKLTGRENLRFFGALYRQNPAERERRSSELIERLNLTDIADRAVETYSSGQKMKLAFAKSLLNDAPLLILDEPTNALDFPTARELQSLVRELKREGKTIVYTTHIMAEAEALCDRVGIIDRGRVLAVGTVPELKSSLQNDELLEIEGLIPLSAIDASRSLNGICQTASSVVDGFTNLTLVTDNARASLPELIRILTAHEAVIHRVKHKETSLEDVFIAHTGRTLAEDTRVH